MTDTIQITQKRNILAAENNKQTDEDFMIKLFIMAR